MSSPSHSRRRFLQLTAAGAGLLIAPRLVLAKAATERRFVFVIQRGGADGLDTVIPYADPAYARLRAALAIDTAAATKLDATFALHPSLAEIGKLYAAQQALFVHAVASPYRDRSHFDGQHVLESGGAARFLAQKEGPRIAMLETGGWDTHSAQKARLANQLRSLDAIIAALRDGLGDAWSETTVLVATEFGRTAAANGTGGTDHGTASVA